MSILTKTNEYPKIGLIILSYIAFIALGMPDGLLGIAWPSIRNSFSIPLDAVGMLLTAFVIGYLFSTFSSGPLISRFSVGTILSASCTITGLSMIGYTLVPDWWMMVGLGIASGLGAGAIDAVLNSFAAAHFSEGLMQWLHASYGIGITLGPIIMTIALSTMNSWQAGYRITGSFQLVLAICFVLTLEMWNKKTDSIQNTESKQLTDYKTPLRETLVQVKVWLSTFLFFIYVGIEVSLGTWAYTLLIESRGIQHEIAAIWTGSYWASFTIGRILAGLLVKRIGNNRLVSYSLIAGFLGSALLGWNPLNVTSLGSVAVIGFAIAPVFPALMSGTSQRVGAQFTVNTIGMQMAAGSLGAALIPSIVGILARWISLEIIPVCLILLFTILMGLHLLAIRFGSNTKANIYT